MGKPYLKLTIKNSDLNSPFSDEKYSRIFIELYTPLCRYVLKFVNEKDVAEDIVQECFAYLWENWQRLANIEEIEYYLFKSVKNRSLNYLKKQFTYKDESLSSDNYTSIIDTNYPSAHELMEFKDLELILEKALQQLPNGCRTIFVLKRFDEKSNKEIAGLLSISVKTVENQMTIAIRKLRNYVVKYWGDSGLILLNIFLNVKK